jgi:DEAD/DEAH box helicase domain-containing protein
MQADHVILDIEIIHEIGGTEGYTWDDTDKLGVSCASVYEVRTDRFKLYGPDDLEALKMRLDACERLTTFNGWAFDLPVIWGMEHRQRVEAYCLKTDDLLRRIWQANGLDPDVFSDAHKGYGLDVVCQATLGIGKIGYGGDAPTWYRQGQWARVATYCQDDVTLTRDLCRFIDQYGYIINPKYQTMLTIPTWIPGM